MHHEQEDVRSYGRCAAGISDVYRPVSIDEVNEVFEIAKTSEPRRRIAIRGGGHSFDGQALHETDDGDQIVLSSSKFKPDLIQFNNDTVTLGAGVTWGKYLSEAIHRSRTTGTPILLPGSLQTGENSTVAGTLSGDCLSRFSGLGGKESAWIESFRILTPQSGMPIAVTEASDPDLFHAAIGGLGYLGFITDVTYRLIEIDAESVARSTITVHENFRDLIEKQLELIAAGGEAPRGISSAWFIPPIESWFHHSAIKGGVFDSVYAKPSQPRLHPFPLYHDVDGEGRYWIEVLLARIGITNLAIHEFLFYFVKEHDGKFEDNLFNFLFFMDGNALAKKKFEREFFPAQFPIEQQTYVVPADRTEQFALNCMRKARETHGIHPTECDMLFVKADKCLMSANYDLDGFAITIGFEPLIVEGCPPPDIPRLFRELSADCDALGGRIHLTKNVYADRDVFRHMFSPQIEKFEEIKRRHDPELLLQNKFSDGLFRFEQAAAAPAIGGADAISQD